MATSSAVLSEEALRARDVALYGQAGKGNADDTVLEVDEEVHICLSACASIPAVCTPLQAWLQMDVQPMQQCMFGFAATQLWATVSNILCRLGIYLSSAMHAALLCCLLHVTLMPLTCKCYKSFPFGPSNVTAVMKQRESVYLYDSLCLLCPIKVL